MNGNYEGKQLSRFSAFNKCGHTLTHTLEHTQTLVRVLQVVVAVLFNIFFEASSRIFIIYEAALRVFDEFISQLFFLIFQLSSATELGLPQPHTHTHTYIDGGNVSGRKMRQAFTHSPR